MQKVKSFFPFILSGSAALALSLSGCATQHIPVHPDAKNVTVINGLPLKESAEGLPGCAFKGKIFVSTVLPYKTSNLPISQNEINLLKNKALLLDANKVVINHDFVAYKSKEYTHAIVGSAYQCPALVEEGY